MPEATQLLAAIAAGDARAAPELLRLVYAELHRLAAAHMAREAPQATLSPTVLVHEAYLRLVDPAGQLAFENRRHFFGAAAQAMRRILVDAARHRRRQKRGGAAQRVELVDVAQPDVAQPDVPQLDNDEQLLALDEALQRLARIDPAAAEVVELHHFAGLSHEQTAETLSATVYHVRQKWTFARAWLRDALE